MAKKPKVKDQVEPQGITGAMGESRPLSQRIIGTGAYEIQPYFRAGKWAELQKFGYKEEARQLLLGEDSDLLNLESKVEIYGLDLTVSEDKALHAVQKLLSRTDYKGNIPGEERQITDFKWEGYIPRLSTTYSEYYEAYGLKPAGDGRYHGAQAKEALLALKSLADARVVCYKRDRWIGTGKNRKEVSDIIRAKAPLITILEGFRDLEAEEAQTVMAGGELPQKRQTRLLIESSALLVDQIDSFYLLKPTALHAEIQALLPGKRYSPSIPRMISYLLTLDMQSQHISKSNLAKKLRLDYLVDQRKQTLLNHEIQEALDIALRAGYLLEYDIKPVSRKEALIEMKLNPKKCIGLKSKKRTKKQEEAV